MRGAALKKIAGEVRPTAFVDYCEYLSVIYQKLKSDNPHYTFISYAEDLGYSAATNLHNIIRGKRKLTQKSGRNIAKALALPAHQTQYFLLLVALKNTKDNGKREEMLEELLNLKQRYDQDSLSSDQLELCRDWYHFVVRELIGLPHVKQTPAALASCITPRIRPVQVRKSLELLLRLGMIRYNVVSGRLEPCQGAIQSGAETQDLLVVKFHQSMLEISKNSIDTISETERDISANLFRVSQEKLQMIKKRVYEFQQEILSAEAGVAETDRLYQLNFQLFPISVPLERPATEAKTARGRGDISDE